MTAKEGALFQPIQLKSMGLKNRIALAPMLSVPVGDDKCVNDQTIAWCEKVARGGTGLLMLPVQALTLEKQECLGAGERLALKIMPTFGPALDDDKYIAGYARLADMLHSYGAKLGLQILLVGPVAGKGASPSPYPDERSPEISTEKSHGIDMKVREVTVEEIGRFEEACATAAARAKKAGVDCVELHCAHGGATLHCSFISPYYNRRTDRYGSSWENRLRFPVETLAEMRKAVGEDYPILARISADEWLGKRGITLEDTVKHIVPALEKAGVDCFDVSQGSITHSPDGVQLPLYHSRGCVIHYAEAVKKATTVPVIGVGRILDLNMAEKFLQEGKADIIYMARQLMADPETPNKYREGRPEDIRKCIGDTSTCGAPCIINYDTKADPVPLVQTNTPKKVLVIGGGVGGMEAARIAALRGHKTILMEKDSELGGIVAALALTPMMGEFQNIVEFLATQLSKLKVDVRVCKDATAADVEELKPDVVIVAAGSSLVLPEVTRGKPGVMTHIEALKKKKEIGQRVVIWGLVAAELAISLADEGKDVVLMGRGGIDSLGKHYPDSRKWYTLRKLTDMNLSRGIPQATRMDNVEVLCHVDVKDITAEGIRVADKEGANRVLPYDTLIISRESQANDSLFEKLQGKAAEVYKVGDCRKVGDIRKAIWSANEVARRI